MEKRSPIVPLPKEGPVPPSDSDLTGLERKIGVTFKDRDLLRNALVHASYLNENQASTTDSNERLEFLGDAILSQTIALHLYRTMPDAAEGELTRLRALLVRRDTLADVARSIDLGSYLVFGKGEEASGGPDRPANLADGLEALLGAVYLDQGEAAAHAVIERLLVPLLERMVSHGQATRDAKSLLQERLQAEYGETPSYRLLEEWGSDHEPRFVVEVFLGKRPLGRGTGLSKRVAEQDAAQAALRQIAADSSSDQS